MAILRRALAAATALALTSPMLTTTVARADGSKTDEGPTKVLLMLDSSGSMNDKDPSGVTKLEAAKKALGGAVDTLPPDSQVGLRVYGATINVPRPTTASCHDTQLVAPLAALDAAALKQRISTFTAKGDTPMAYSLIQGINDLGKDGRRHIILVSDGQETCTKDPCAEVAKALEGSGVSLQVDTVGFAVDETTRKQLQCIAGAGRGTYYDAKDAGQLSSALSRLSTRTARSFTVKGTPVHGSSEPGKGAVLTAGQYTDSVIGDPNDDRYTYYRIRRQTPGSTLHVSFLGRAPLDANYLSLSSWVADLIAPGDVNCGHVISEFDPLQFGTINSMTFTARAKDPRDSEHEADSCATATELMLKIDLTKGKAVRIPTEIRVIETPPATNDAQLPAGVAHPPKGNSASVTPANATFTQVVGGSSFNDAMAVEPGSYVTEVVPGEKVFFSMPLDWGQSAVFSMDGVPSNLPALAAMTNTDALPVAGDVYAPNFGQIDSQSDLRSVYYSGLTHTMEHPDVNQVPPVRYRNLWDSEPMYGNRGFAMAGRYYFSVSIGLGHYGAKARGVPIPVRFTLTRSGSVTGVPTFASAGPAVTPSGTSSASGSTASAPASPSPAATASPSQHGWLLPVGAAIATVLVGAGIGVVLVRRRRH